MARLVLDVKVGDMLELEGGITLSVQQKSGQRARLCFERDTPMQIQQRQAERRSEVREGNPGRRQSDGK